MKKTTKSSISVGVIGVGFGWCHIQALLQKPGTLRLKYACDVDRARLEATKAKMPADCGVIFTTDYMTVFHDPEIDVVALSLPHHLHRRFAIEAAQCGKNIMIDKPIAPTLEDAEAINKAVAAAGVQLAVAFNFRYDPFYASARRMLQEGAIGKVLLAVTRHYQAFNPPAASNWRNAKSVGGGCVMGSGVHNIDMLRFCLGEPDEVFAYTVGDPKRIDAEAAATISFKYACGTIVNFLCNWVKSSSHRTPDPATMFGEWEFYGETGELRSHGDRNFRLTRLGGDPEPVARPGGDAMVNLWTHFEDCLRTGKTPLTNGEDATKTLALLLKVYESARMNKPVRA
ncbi:MAG: Gfo/Idh/MocA family protein [Kiritimatiellia bacterium]|jgi:predicted dehydrogenase